MWYSSQASTLSGSSGRAAGFALSLQNTLSMVSKAVLVTLIAMLPPGGNTT